MVETGLVIVNEYIWTMLAAGRVLSLVNVLSALINFAMSGLELAIAVLQAYTFILLIYTCINDVIHLY